MRTIPEVAEDILNILDEAERTEECNRDTLCDINELVGEILVINSETSKAREKIVAKLEEKRKYAFNVVYKEAMTKAIEVVKHFLS